MRILRILILSIYVRKDSFPPKSMMQFYFAMDCFIVSLTVLDITTLAPKFITRRQCKQSHENVHSYINILKYHFDHYTCQRSKMKGLKRLFESLLK